MKKQKIVIYSLILVLLVTCIGFGIITMFVQNRYKNNNVSFEVNDNMGYCKVSGKYYYNGEEITEKAYAEQEYSLRSDLDEKPFRGFAKWDLGQSIFNVDYKGENPETLTYVISITNLNKEKPLSITISDVAVGEKLRNNQMIMCFYTTISYKINGVDNVDNVLFSNKDGEEVNTGFHTIGEKFVNINSGIDVPVNGEIIITISIERKTKTEQFSFDNNFKVNIGVAG